MKIGITVDVMPILNRIKKYIFTAAYVYIISNLELMTVTCYEMKHS